MGSKVILYSGGMDSMALHYLNPECDLLYFDMGTEYSEQEKERLPNGTRVIPLPLGQWELENKIIPMRNLILVSLASIYGDTILIGATAGDRVLDKSPQFLNDVSDLLTYLWQPQHWTEGKRVRVVAPFKKLTKTQILASCAAVGVAKQVVERSFSCYTPVDGLECGQCKPCFRKWVAAERMGIPVEYRHKAMEYGRQIREEILQRKDEYKDTMMAYREAGVDFA